MRCAPKMAAAVSSADAAQVVESVHASLTGRAQRGLKRKAGDTNGDEFRAIVGGEDLSGLAETFRMHPVHQQAFTAYVSHVLQHPLAWARKTGKGPEDYEWPQLDTVQKTPEIPAWCKRFVADAVESFMVAGWFVWVPDKKAGAAYVVPPELVTLVSDPASPGWDVYLPASQAALRWAKGKASNLNLVIISAPSRMGCRSGACRAAADTQRYMEMERNFDQRDSHNSRPAVYTTVSHDLKNQHGSTRQWFRSANAADVAGYRGNIDADFNDLIARRADTVRQLHDITVAERERLSADSHMPVGAKPVMESGPEHQEHIVTDGREATQLHMLNSLTDGKTEMDRVYTNIMIAFGVPPQIFGKNVNTERHAASNRLTESAVDMFSHHCAMLREELASALAKACAEFHGKFFISFKPYLGREEADRLLPMLKKDFAVVVLATAYGLPERHINTDMIDEINLFDHARIRMYQGAGGKARQGPPGDTAGAKRGLASAPSGASAAKLHEKAPAAAQAKEGGGK